MSSWNFIAESTRAWTMIHFTSGKLSACDKRMTIEICYGDISGEFWIDKLRYLRRNKWCWKSDEYELKTWLL